MAQPGVNGFQYGLIFVGILAAYGQVTGVGAHVALGYGQDFGAVGERAAVKPFNQSGPVLRLEVGVHDGLVKVVVAAHILLQCGRTAQGQLNVVFVSAFRRRETLDAHRSDGGVGVVFDAVNGGYDLAYLGRVVHVVGFQLGAVDHKGYEGAAFG